MRRRWWPAAFALLLLAGTAHADDQLVARLAAAAPAANPQVLSLAARAAECARRQALLDGFHHLAVIDYSLPSTQPRLWVFDVDRGRLLFQELVAHGRNTGERIAERFSNVEGSKMSSLGLFQAADTYYGNNGYSGADLERRGVPFAVLPRQEVLGHARELARQLAEKPRSSLVALKGCLVAELRRELPAAIEQELAMQELTFHRPEVRQRILEQFGG